MGCRKYAATKKSPIIVKFRNRTVFIVLDFLSGIFIVGLEAVLSVERRVLVDDGELWKRTMVIIFKAIV